MDIFLSRLLPTVSTPKNGPLRPSIVWSECVSVPIANMVAELPDLPSLISNILAGQLPIEARSERSISNCAQKHTLRSHREARRVGYTLVCLRTHACRGVAEKWRSGAAEVRCRGGALDVVDAARAESRWRCVGPQHPWAAHTVTGDTHDTKMRGRTPASCRFPRKTGGSTRDVFRPRCRCCGSHPGGATRANSIYIL